MLKKSLVFKIISIIIASFIFFTIIPFNNMGMTQYANASIEGNTSIAIDGKVIPSNQRAIVEGEKVYMPVDVIKEYIYSDVVFDKEHSRFFVNIKTPLFNLETTNLDERIRRGIQLNFITKRFDNIDYIGFNGMEKIFGITMEYDKIYNRISINKKEIVTTGEKKGITLTRVSVYNSKSFIGREKLEILGKDADIEVLEEYDTWAKVKTEKENIGYVLKSGVSIYDEGSIVGEKLNEVREDFKLDVKEEVIVGKSEAITLTRVSVYDTKSFIGSEKLEILGKDKKVLILEEYDMWVKVKTEKENIGFVLKSGLSFNNTASSNKNATLNLSWDYVYKNSPDLSDDETIEGLDVLSPTWFNIGDSTGTVVNRGDINYVNEAHKKGYKVWGMFSNSYNKDLTRNILISEEKQQKVINQIVVYSSLYDLDGINIDFENVYYEDKDKFTKFVQDLTYALKEQNIIVSIDMTVPAGGKNSYQFYDREKLGKIVDYCMIMAYDEHWAASPVSGSVASIPWVKRGIENTLKYIPSEKIILGIPFYTRIWKETKLEDGSIKVKSKSISMKTTNEIIKEKKLTPVWLEDIGQYYVEYYEDGTRCRIWIENEKSIYLKSNLVHEYNLSGVASWRKGLEEENIWKVIDGVLN